MTRLALLAALLVAPAFTQVTPPPAAAAAPLPPLLAALDTQARTGAALGPTDPHCDDHDAVAASLIDDYSETVVRQVALDGGRGLELWASPERGSWTLVYLRADRIACVAEFGGGWTPGQPVHPLIDRPQPTS